MKKNYVQPELEVLKLGTSDILMSFEISFNVFDEVFGGDEQDA